MKILFNLCNVSLGNNGGSHTLIKSCNTLLKLGIDVTVIDTGKIQYTWSKLKTKHLIIKNDSVIPNSDIVIATGFDSFEHTINLPKRCGRKFVYLRGYELWKNTEKKLIQILSNPKITKIVNSIGLKDKLKQFDINSHIIYPGYDFNEIFPLNIRNKNKKIIIGGLYNTKHKTKRTDWILKIVKVLKRNKRNIELWMIGNENKPNTNLIDVYYHQPDINNKNIFYNNIDIFLSTSIREGLHLCPAEAMMTECPVVGVDHELNGTKDYLINKATGILTENNFEAFLYGVLKLIDNSNLRTKLGIYAREKILSIGTREYNMTKLINFLEEKNEN